MNLSTFATLFRIKLVPPSIADKTADADRIKNALEKEGYRDIIIPLNVIRKLSGEIRKRDFDINVVIGFEGDRAKVIDVSAENVLGLAIDIGSTNISYSLADLLKGKKIYEIDFENPQIEYGQDVLSRVQRSMLDDNNFLSNVLIQGINSHIEKICKKNNIFPDSIFSVVVAGNTIMSHYFLGLDVRNIPVSPWVPSLNSGIIVSAEEIGLSVNRNAIVYVFPNCGSYVGGDIISGILYSGIYRENDPTLFIDVGTNVEITIGCSEWIMVGAGAAGPALEGGVAEIGRKAGSGTIRGIRIDRETCNAETDVISGIEPYGICGSGMIDLIAELFKNGIIDQAGRFREKCNKVMKKDGQKAYQIYKNNERELFITEDEIQNFLRSKSAMFSFLYLFTRSIGLSFKDYKRVYVAGALGCGINIENAVGIGMLPDISRDRLIPLGNASLRGAEMLLLDRGLLKTVEEIRMKITYMEMAEESELLNIMQGAMFIPHTDPEILKG